MFLQIEAELSETVTYSSLNFAISDGVNTVTTRLLLVIFIYVVLSLFFFSIYNKLNIIISYRTPCAHIHKFIYIYIYLLCRCRTTPSQDPPSLYYLQGSGFGLEKDTSRLHMKHDPNEPHHSLVICSEPLTNTNHHEWTLMVYIHI